MTIETYVSTMGTVVAASAHNMVTVAPRRGVCSARFAVLIRHGDEWQNRVGVVIDAERAATELGKLEDAELAAWVRAFAAGEAAS